MLFLATLKGYCLQRDGSKGMLFSIHLLSKWLTVCYCIIVLLLLQQGIIEKHQCEIGTWEIFIYKFWGDGVKICLVM